MISIRKSRAHGYPISVQLEAKGVTLESWWTVQVMREMRKILDEQLAFYESDFYKWGQSKITGYDLRYNPKENRL